MKSILKTLEASSIANAPREVQKVFLQSHSQMVDWLVELYTKLEKPDEVSKWTEERSRTESSTPNFGETE